MTERRYFTGQWDEFFTRLGNSGNGSVGIGNGNVLEEPRSAGGLGGAESRPPKELSSTVTDNGSL